jgi:hypothetical protein
LGEEGLEDGEPEGFVSERVRRGEGEEEEESG